MLEQFARSTAQLQREEAIERGIITRDTPPYELGFKEQVRNDSKRIKEFAIAYKQQYVWGKFGKSCGLTIEQANDVFDTSIQNAIYDTKRVVNVVVFLATRNRNTEKMPHNTHYPPRPINQV